MLGADSRRLDDFNRWSISALIGRKKTHAAGQYKKLPYKVREYITESRFGQNYLAPRINPGIPASLVAGPKSPNHFGIDKANEACYAVQLLLSHICHSGQPAAKSVMEVWLAERAWSPLRASTTR
jgi:hypothetical protein